MSLGLWRFVMAALAASYTAINSSSTPGIMATFSLQGWLVEGDSRGVLGLGSLAVRGQHSTTCLSSSSFLPRGPLLCPVWLVNTWGPAVYFQGVHTHAQLGIIQLGPTRCRWREL